MAAPKVEKWESGKLGKWERIFQVVGKGGGGVVASLINDYLGLVRKSLRTT